jgi:hypothetical protein
MGIIYDQPKGVALEGLTIGRGNNFFLNWILSLNFFSLFILSPFCGVVVGWWAIFPRCNYPPCHVPSRTWVATILITALFITRGWVYTYIYILSPGMDITLILKVPTGYYNACIKFNRYRGRGLSDTDSSQCPKWKRSNSLITVSLRFFFVLPGLEDMVHHSSLGARFIQV